MNSWQTAVSIKKPPFEIKLGSSFYMMGSCFSDHLKIALVNNLFRVSPSPFGIEYNPISMAQGLTRILNGKKYELNDIVQTGSSFTTWSHHSQVLFKNQNELLHEINNSLVTSFQDLKNAEYLMITLGTAFFYSLKNTLIAVNNCHKMPPSLFSRRAASVEEMVKALAPCLEKIKSENNKIKFIFTLSPVKHLRDDPTENSYSKALCRCSIEELIKLFIENSYYFPAYEIMTDELRDYRFYDSSMTHPSAEAAQFIISKFFEVFLDGQGRKFQKEWLQVLKFLQHRSHQVNLEDYLNENLNQKNKILALQKEYPSLNWSNFSAIF